MKGNKNIKERLSLFSLILGIISICIVFYNHYFPFYIHPCPCPSIEVECAPCPEMFDYNPYLFLFYEFLLPYIPMLFSIILGLFSINSKKRILSIIGIFLAIISFILLIFVF